MRSILAVLVLMLLAPAPARAKPAGCPWPQSCMTPRGETVRGIFRPWPKGDAPPRREKRR